MKIKVFNILYDTDGEDVELPQEFEVEVDDHEDVGEELAEWITDQTGFCHKGFDYEVLE